MTYICDIPGASSQRGSQTGTVGHVSELGVGTVDIIVHEFVDLCLRCLSNGLSFGVGHERRNSFGTASRGFCNLDTHVTRPRSPKGRLFLYAGLLVTLAISHGSQTLPDVHGRWRRS